MDNEQLRELKNLSQSYQDKYVYYFLALAVTAIGFALTQTQDMKQFNWIDVLLGISVVAWGISFYLGTRNRERNNLLINHQYHLEIVKAGQHPKLGNDPINIEEGSKIIEKSIELNNEKLSMLGVWQRNWFFIGIISFVAWRSLEIAIS